MRYGDVFHTLTFSSLTIAALAAGCNLSDSGLGARALGVSSDGAAATTGTGDAGERAGAGGSLPAGGSNAGPSTDGGAVPYAPDAVWIPLAVGSQDAALAPGDGPVAAGGSIGTGGATAMGGATAIGGTTAIGGAPAIGGTSGTSGANAIGGATAIGGSKAIDGTPATGGSSAIAGSSATGGTAVTGGAIATSGSTRACGDKCADAGSTADATEPPTVSCQALKMLSDWCACDQWGQISKADTTYYNDIWGSGAGAQCIWMASKSWGAIAVHPKTDGVKSYPNVSVSPRKAISDIKTYTSSFDITVPTGGVWDAAYDLTLKKGSASTSVMLWVNYTEARALLESTSSPVISDLSLGGHVWNVYYGKNGVDGPILFLRTSNVSAGTVDIKAILTWLVANRPPLDATWTLDQVQFGFEIVANDLPQIFTCNSFTVSSS